jgi:hypothetical protein
MEMPKYKLAPDFDEFTESNSKFESSSANTILIHYSGGGSAM